MALHLLDKIIIIIIVFVVYPVWFIFRHLLEYIVVIDKNIIFSSIFGYFQCQILLLLLLNSMKKGITKSKKLQCSLLMLSVFFLSLVCHMVFHIDIALFSPF